MIWQKLSFFNVGRVPSFLRAETCAGWIIFLIGQNHWLQGKVVAISSGGVEIHAGRGRCSCQNLPEHNVTSKPSLTAS
eukprot:m.486401 g.486401  ORF g.486401 m.486401 type:complete len:78 (+) comp77634_c0_seq1:145-378(+)